MGDDHYKGDAKVRSYVEIMIASTCAASVGLFYKLADEHYGVALEDFNAMRWVFGVGILIPYIWLIEAKKFPCPKCPDGGRVNGVFHALLIVATFFAFVWACSILTLTQVVCILSIWPFFVTLIKWIRPRNGYGLTIWDVIGFLGCVAMIVMIFKESSSDGPATFSLAEDGTFVEDKNEDYLGLIVACSGAGLTALAVYMGYPIGVSMNIAILNQSMFGTILGGIYLAVWYLMEKDITIFSYGAMGYIYALSAASCDLCRLFMLVRAAKVFHGSHHSIAIVQTFTVGAALCFDYFILDDMIEGNELIYTLCIPAIAFVTSFLDSRKSVAKK